MIQHATGSFDVKTAPLPPYDPFDGALTRMSLDKQLHGDLEAISRGEGLATGDYSKGNAGYVAIERVSGTLRGHRGTFILQHSSTVTAGVPRQSISVVPGSGTGELAGISGAMNIRIESGGKHFYDFDYSLPAK